MFVGGMDGESPKTVVRGIPVGFLEHRSVLVVVRIDP